MGAITINTILTFAAVAVVMAIVIIDTAPTIPAVPLVVALCAMAATVPVAVYPFTYTIWLAIDLRVHPPDQTELDDAAAACAESSTRTATLPAGARRSGGRGGRGGRSPRT